MAASPVPGHGIRGLEVCLSPFPATRHSLVEAIVGPDLHAREVAADLLVRAYRPAVVATLRMRWRLETEDAEDLAQEFFARLLELRWLDRFDPSRARFRTFLRVCLDRFASNAHQAGRRLKRGGGALSVTLDHAPEMGADDTDERFRQEWIRAVMAIAIESLQREAAERDKLVAAALFEEYDIADHPDDARPSYRSLAVRHGIPETQVTNHLAWARRAFRVHVLAALRALAGSEAEFRSDARELLGLTIE